MNAQRGLYFCVFVSFLCVLSAFPTAQRVDIVKNPQATRERFCVCLTSSILSAVNVSSKYSVYGGTLKLE